VIKQAEAQGLRYGGSSRVHQQVRRLHPTKVKHRSALRAGISCVTRTRADIPGLTICISAVMAKLITTTLVNYPRLDGAPHGAII